MINLAFYTQEVLPHIDINQRQMFLTRYPQIVLQLGQRQTCKAAELPVLMLVGLTGAGKTTTLNALAERRAAGRIAYSDGLPARRDLADMIVIPTAQVLLGKPVVPVRDRVQRFRYTRVFAGYVPGGLAAVFSWLHLTTEPADIILSEGIRGPDEIAFTLDHCPNWHILELAADVIARLTRLSDRADSFDRAQGSTDVDLLPLAVQGQVLTALQSGAINPAALAIVRAEAQNYGLASVGADHPRYRCVQTDDSPEHEVADRAVAILQEMVCYA